MTWMTAALALGCAAAVLPARAQTHAWPDKTVRLIVPAPPASSLDVIARALAERLKERWKQAVVIENKAGAGGMLGMDAVAKAAPDGTTLGVGFNGPIAFAPAMARKMAYDPARDLVPVVLTTIQPNVLAVPASNPAKDFAEFVAGAKKQGSSLSYGSVGIGSSSHLAMELLKATAGFEAVHVPYNGSPPAAASLAAGDTQMLLSTAPALLALVQAGKVRMVAVTSAQRYEGLKDLPTVAEAGYPGFEALAWNGLFAPAGTPAEVVAKVNADVTAVLAEPEVKALLQRQGLAIGAPGNPASFKTFIEAETRKWGAIIRKAGITTD
jgi:tripartite-type tricarboxylate transporter receptor subunit TctC